MRNLRICAIFVLLLCAAALLRWGYSTSSTAETTSHHRTSFYATVWNERGFPAMSPSQYRHDLNSSRSGFARLPSLAYLGAEFDEGLNMPYARAYARAHGIVIRDGWAQSGNRADTSEFFTPNADLVLGTTRSQIFHRAPAGPHSPHRRYVATETTIAGFPVLFVALHLTNGCFSQDASNWWYPARCAAVREEIAWIRSHIVAPAHAANQTVVVGGDMNTGRMIQWGAREAAIRPRTYMQLAVVPATGVRADISDLTVLARNSSSGLFTDHLTVRARISMSPLH